MRTNESNIYLRVIPTRERVGLPRSTFWRHIQMGLFPPPLHFGPMLTVWPEHEVERFIAARAAGYTCEQLRELVAEIIKLRKRALKELDAREAREGRKAAMA